MVAGLPPQIWLLYDLKVAQARVAALDRLINLYLSSHFENRYRYACHLFWQARNEVADLEDLLGIES